MSEREVVMERVRARMVDEYTVGNLAAARNLQCLLESLEGMTEKGYAEIALASDGVIS